MARVTKRQAFEARTIDKIEAHVSRHLELCDALHQANSEMLRARQVVCDAAMGVVNATKEDPFSAPVIRNRSKALDSAIEGLDRAWEAVFGIKSEMVDVGKAVNAEVDLFMNDGFAVLPWDLGYKIKTNMPNLRCMRYVVTNDRDFVVYTEEEYVVYSINCETACEFGGVTAGLIHRYANQGGDLKKRFSDCFYRALENARRPMAPTPVDGRPETWDGWPMKSPRDDDLSDFDVIPFIAGNRWLKVHRTRTGTDTLWDDPAFVEHAKDTERAYFDSLDYCFVCTACGSPEWDAYMCTIHQTCQRCCLHYTDACPHSMSVRKEGNTTSV